MTLDDLIEGEPICCRFCRNLLYTEDGLEPDDACHSCLIKDLERHLVQVRGCLAAFAETAEATVLHHETRGAGGQQVPFHGDFSSVPPSVVGRLRWWAREMRSCLADKPSAQADLFVQGWYAAVLGWFEDLLR